MELSPDVRALIEGLQRELAELRAANAAVKQENAALKQDRPVWLSGRCSW
jgi:cell division protein FtsB